MKPLFSCVMPVKGARPFMDAAIASLRAQEMGDDLEIIVQDGDVEPDGGQSEALNKGFAKAHGEWLFWLNADDVLLPGALNKVRSFIDSSTLNSDPGSINWIAGNTVYIDECGRRVDSRWNGRWHAVLNRHLPTWTFGPSAFFTRDLWIRRGGFDTDFRCSMDIELWTRWAMSGERYSMLPDYLWGFRWHSGSTTAGGANRELQDREHRMIDVRYGFAHAGFWRFVSRVTQLADGSWFRRKRF